MHSLHMRVLGILINGSLIVHSKESELLTSLRDPQKITKSVQ